MLKLNLTQIKTVEPEGPGQPERMCFAGYLFKATFFYSLKDARIAEQHCRELLDQEVFKVLVYTVERIILYTKVYEAPILRAG